MNKKIKIKSNNKKPNLYKNEIKKEKEIIRKNENCPFCIDGFIEKEKYRILSIHENNKVLWIKNKFPISDVLDSTLIIESDKCGESIHNFDLIYLKELIDFIFEKRNEMINSNLYDFVFVYRNYGKESSGSIPHSHTQINGLKKNSDVEVYDKVYSYSGDIIESSSNTTAELLFSNEPMTEYMELNICWSEDKIPLDAAFYLQKTIQYMDFYKDGLYESYNLIFNEIEGKKYIKVIYRSSKAAFTPYYLAYDISLVFDDNKEIISSIKEFLIK